MTSVHFACAQCGRAAVLSSSDALKLPLGWYRIQRDLLGAYVCSWDCVVALGPTLIPARAVRS